MTERLLSAGYYQLKSVKIYPFNVSEFVEAVLLVPALSITTSIDSDFMSGYLDFIDSTGLIDLPLRGEERVLITVMDTLENEITYDMFCYKIDNLSTNDHNDKMTYRMHLISYQSFKANKTRITRAFKNGKVSDYITELFEQNYTVNETEIRDVSNSFYSGNKPIVVSQTENNLRCIIPNLTPGEAINFLNKRAYSSESASSSFRFFENTKGFYFVSDEDLFDTIAEPVIEITDPKPSKVFTLTYYINLSKNPLHIREQMNNLHSISNPERFNTINDMFGGTYRNKVFLIDILAKTVNLKDPGYNYMEARDRYFSRLKYEPVDRHTSEFITEYFNESTQQNFLVVKDYDDTAENAEYSLPGNYVYDEMISNRLAFRRHLDSVTISGTGPGRLDITAGNLVDLRIPKFDFARGQYDNSQLNPHMSGLYIVKHVTHQMNMELMTNNYVLTKLEWSQSAEGSEEEIL